MTLDEYLKTKWKKSELEFAVACELSQSQINRLRRKRSRPSLAAIKRIADQTKGAVSFNDWFEAEQEVSA